MNIQRIIYNSDYVEALKEKENHRKARAFMIYLHDLNLGVHPTNREYAKAWGTATATAHLWLQDFNKETDETERFIY